MVSHMRAPWQQRSCVGAPSSASQPGLAAYQPCLASRYAQQASRVVHFSLPNPSPGNVDQFHPRHRPAIHCRACWAVQQHCACLPAATSATAEQCHGIT